MLVDELSGKIPGYRVAVTTEAHGRKVLSLVNEATGERFAIDELRLDQFSGMGAASMGKRISEDLTLLAAGMSVEGVRKVQPLLDSNSRGLRLVDDSDFALSAMSPAS